MLEASKDASQCCFCPTASSSAPLSTARSDFYVQSQEQSLSMWPPKETNQQHNNNKKQNKMKNAAWKASGLQDGWSFP